MRSSRPAALAAEAHHFVAAKPDGYAAMVAEHGMSPAVRRSRAAASRRSPGRCSSDAPILILDEATTRPRQHHRRRACSVRLAALVKAVRTTFVIGSIACSTVRRCRPLILVIKDGRLVEQGRYEELVRLGGVFAELDAQGKVRRRRARNHAAIDPQPPKTDRDKGRK